MRQHDVLKDAGDLNGMNRADMPDEAEVTTLSSEELMSYVRSLPEGFRTVFNLYAVEGYSHREIGGILHISESTSRSQYMRARKMLQKMILKN
jgi:RNA polymerase sigma-70 factor (ECF subfamily)